MLKTNQRKYTTSANHISFMLTSKRFATGHCKKLKQKDTFVADLWLSALLVREATTTFNTRKYVS